MNEKSERVEFSLANIMMIIDREANIVVYKDDKEIDCSDPKNYAGMFVEDIKAIMYDGIPAIRIDITECKNYIFVEN